ncbi:ATP-binding protein [Motiliproteus coralliicola]|uniref:ATP-binding protein n=1 Tax=Motiliproteus coralliicola TaxID=2283196 RepID=A0A369WAL4_9GAMM|nr:ATP-binding protein [Motiliproteus coralliicola]RDE18852.1 ATP-binding protein [Motiliproteus coralliicola]
MLHLRPLLILYFCAALIGASVGVFILFPVNELVFYHEFKLTHSSGFAFAGDQLVSALAGEAPLKTLFYSLVGALLGLASAFVYLRFHRQVAQVQQLSRALANDIERLISQGESAELEFKSSMRWDYQKNSANKELEFVILKSIAGFLNGRGGTLLIGVDDDANVLGLEKDFDTLRRKDADGFEQFVMTAITNQLGTEMCQYCNVIFHNIRGETVCRLVIGPSPKPVYLKKSGNTKFYLRSGGGTRELNIQEVMEYAQNRWK